MRKSNRVQNFPRSRKFVFTAACGSLLAYWGLQAKPYQPVQALPANIVDMHCHVAGIGSGNSGCFVSPKLQGNWRFSIYLRSFGVSQRELREKGDMLVADRISQLLAQSKTVKKAVLLAMDGAVGSDGALDTNRTEIYVPNEFVAAAARTHTNLLFGASINPYRRDALDRLAAAKNQGAVLVKWIPAIMDIDPGDPKLAPFYREMARLNLPLLTHCGRERSFTSAQDELSDPEKLNLPLSLGVKVIVAHTAANGIYQGERGPERLARMMTRYPNLYSDISALTQVNKAGCLKVALRTPEFSGRLVYGSDFPLINTALVSPWYYIHRLTPAQALSIAFMRNPWDADVALKQLLGTPASVFDSAWLVGGMALNSVAEPLASTNVSWIARPHPNPLPRGEGVAQAAFL